MALKRIPPLPAVSARLRSVVSLLTLSAKVILPVVAPVLMATSPPRVTALAKMMLVPVVVMSPASVLRPTPFWVKPPVAVMSPTAAVVKRPPLVMVTRPPAPIALFTATAFPVTLRLPLAVIPPLAFPSTMSLVSRRETSLPLMTCIPPIKLLEA